MSVSLICPGMVFSSRAISSLHTSLFAICCLIAVVKVSVSYVTIVNGDQYRYFLAVGFVQLIHVSASPLWRSKIILFHILIRFGIQSAVFLNVRSVGGAQTHCVRAKSVVDMTICLM